MVLSILFGIFSIEVFAKNIEVTAKSVSSTKDTLHADGGVIVSYDNSVIKAAHASYNKTTKILELDGNIQVIGYQGSKEYSDHMVLHTDTKEVTFKKLFLAGEEDIWLLTNTAHRKNNIYHLGHTILSSCDSSRPLWKMVMSDAVYDSNEEYLKAYNTRIHFLDVPIFYTPYLAFSTNKDRSSGLLFPRITYSRDEGIRYEQPIFWAISKSMDLELNPQIRTKRSYGLYGTFRFADSNHSIGLIRAGYFKDKSAYVLEHKLDNDRHFGFEFNYESSSLFTEQTSSELRDGFYINTTYLNDIDYLNLQKNNLEHFGGSPLQESRINYFIHDNNYYMGINAKYFIDTRAKENDKTLQILPSLQWHKYLDTMIWHNLTYSVDAHINNLTRKTGSTMKQAEVKIPLELNYSFFDHFVNIALSEELYYSKYLFGNGEYKYDSFQYYNNTQRVTLFTDLTKEYDDITHVMQPSVEYLNPGTEHAGPVAFDVLDKEQHALFAVGLPEERYSFNFKQYFYDNTKLIFFQRLSQNYYPTRAYKFAALTNEMEYIWGDWTFYNYLVYSPEFKDINIVSNSIELKTSNYNFTLEHSFKQDLTKKEKKVRANDLNFDLFYSTNHIRGGGGFTYDVDHKESKQWRFGIGYYEDCWSIDASFRQDIRPTSGKAEKFKSLSIQLNFIPFGGIGTGEIK